MARQRSGSRTRSARRQAQPQVPAPREVQKVQDARQPARPREVRAVARQYVPALQGAVVRQGQTRVLMLDVGGIILTNGWDRGHRREAAEKFNLDYNAIAERHEAFFDVYELGKISLDDYLDKVIFYKEQPFTREAFKWFMFSQSQPYQDMLDLMHQIKRKHGIRMCALSNEGRELTLYRVHTYKLMELFDLFIASAFVHLSKPDPEIYRLSFDLLQVQANQVIYIEDRVWNVEAAVSMGIPSILHKDFETTRAALEAVGLGV